MDQSKELQELFAAAGPPEAPPNLGNIPDEVKAETPETPAEPPPPVEPPAEEPAPEPETPEAPTDPVQARIAELQEQIAAQNQELAFVRAGQQAQATQQQAPPVPQFTPDNILPMSFSATDLERMGLNATPEAVEMVNNAFRLAALAGANAATERLRAEYQQVQVTQQASTNLRQAFYGANPDLEPYAEVVGAIASNLHQQYPNANAAALMAETAKQARTTLTQRYGVQFGGTSPQAQTAPKVAKQRIKPAAAESGAAPRGTGNTKLTSVEKDILQMMQVG